jgi:2-dehydro-3-deoxygluconokinase
MEDKKTLATSDTADKGIAVIGEVMMEFSPRGDGGFNLGVAGDTYNTAVALARLGFATHYLTGLGVDRYSERIMAALAHHGINAAGVLRVKDRQPALYIIDNDDKGEREFTYWRGHSAARHVLQTPALFKQSLDYIDANALTHLYWSGITLALMSDAVRAEMFAFLVKFRRRGGRVFFDSNYRRVLWHNKREQWQQEMSGAYCRAVASADLYLPSLEDERIIRTVYQQYDDENALIAALRQDCAGTSREVVLTGAGRATWILPDQAKEFDLSHDSQVVDTTGAGDAFSGGLIASLLQGHAMAEAIAFAHRLASTVVTVRGAILPDSTWQTFTTECGS